MEQLAPSLPYGSVPEPLAQIAGFFLVFTYIWRKDVAEISYVPGPAQCNSKSGNNMFTKRNHILYHFSITIHLHLASFYAQKTFKKLARKNAH